MCIRDRLKFVQLQTVSDISLEHVNQKKNPMVYAISYADGESVYFKNQNFWAMSTINKGVDCIFLYNKNHIDEDFYSKNKEILDRKRGSGYWLWKPYFILKTLKSVPENSIVVYSDAGSFVENDLTHLLEKLKSGIIAFRGGHKNEGYFKKDSLVLMGLDKSWDIIRKKQHIQATNLVFRNNKKTRDFVGKWLLFAQDSRILTDSVTTQGEEYPGFIGHRHDQSILNLLCYENPFCQVLGADIESQYFLQHRRRQYDSYFSLWGLKYKKILGRFFCKNIYNSKMVQYIRRLYVD